MSSLTVSCLLVVCALHHVGARATVKGNFTIIGGHPISITEVPFMAMYTRAGHVQWCGASIVHQQFLVSARHCYHPGSHYYVTVGSDKISGGQKYEIEDTFVHPKHTEKHLIDIIVIKLKEKLTFSERVQKINMADPSLVIKKGEILDTIGFGNTGNSSYSEQLLKVDMPFADRKDCQRVYSISDRMMCAGGEEGKGNCFGDSGGPLRYKNQLVGIVSFGHDPCASKGYFTVFTSISAVRDFIDDAIKKNE